MLPSRISAGASSLRQRLVVSRPASLATRCFSTTFTGENGRCHNFSAGPGPIPTDVMLEAEKNFSNYKGTGMGFMEMSHRDADGPVQSTLRNVRESMRTLLKVPDNYQILFFHGGAHGQFSAVPLNFLGNKSKADYLLTGFWAQRAMDEGAKYADVHSVHNAADDGYSTIVSPSKWNIRDDAAYLHICGNETIHGLEFLEDPSLPTDIPLVGDFTSTLLSRPVDISKYGVLFASAGKNLGPAGITVSIVRDDLLGNAHPLTPSILDYTKMVETQSLYNTPPTYLIYMLDLMCDWVKQHGGLEGVEQRAITRASKVYGMVDSTDDFFTNHVVPEYRSRMSVPFRINGGDKELEATFVKESAAAGLAQLSGHHLFGGLRVTLYNGVTDNAVNDLGVFMQEFQTRHGSKGAGQKRHHAA